MATTAASTLCRATLSYVGGPAEVEVHDGRRAALPGWEACGFELVHHAASVEDWDDEAQLVDHQRAMAALAKELTGCDHAVVAGHIKRNPQAAARHPDLGPIAFVHS